MATLTIELAAFRDAPTIARASRDLVERGLGWRWRLPAIARALNDPDIEVIVAKRGHETLGFALLELGESSAHLLLLAVSPRHRRSGVATALMAWLDELCEAAGVFQTRLELRATNTGALAFYRSLGFSVTERRNGYYQGREDAFVMAREVGSAAKR